MSGANDERIWERGWEGHSLAQQRRLARLPLWEKLAWLEEAQRLARQLTDSASRARGTGEADVPPAEGR